MVDQARELDGLLNDEYVPSSVERKKAVLMYFLVGVILALSKDKISVYEFFHLKQSLGWWTVFFICMVFGAVFLFFPYLWIIPLLLFIVFVVVWCIFLKQAREWQYALDENKVVMPIFSGFGEWMLSIFELDVFGVPAATTKPSEKETASWTNSWSDTSHTQ